MNKKETGRKGKIVSVDEYFDHLSDGQTHGLVEAAMEPA